MESTSADFWRMIWENQSHAIVMLGQLKENGEVCNSFELLYYQHLLLWADICVTVYIMYILLKMTELLMHAYNSLLELIVLIKL